MKLCSWRGSLTTVSCDRCAAAGEIRGQQTHPQKFAATRSLRHTRTGTFGRTQIAKVPVRPLLSLSENPNLPFINKYATP
jgi:hypothetical protein